MKIFLFFLLISLVNVILSTVKSLCTIRCGRTITIIMNVVSYGFYAVVVKNTATLPLVITVIGTMLANAFGVYVSYIIMDKFVADKLWKVELALPNVKNEIEEVCSILEESDIPYNKLNCSNWVVFNCYCDTHKETEKCKQICKEYGGKISAYESKEVW